MSVKLRKKDLATCILTIGIFCLCFSNYYISHTIPYWSTLQYYGKFPVLIVLGILLAVQVMVNKGHKLTKTFSLSMIMVFWIVVVTLLKRGQVGDCLDYFLGLVIICLYLELESTNQRKIYIIFSTWVAIIFFLTLIDIFTELKYPDGLYRTEIKLYTEYWFLGYKTERLRYILPMVIMSIYVSFYKQKSLSTIIVCLCAIVSSVLSRGTAASIVLLLISLIYLSITIISKKGEKKYPKILNVVFNYKLLMAIYVIVTVLIVYLQNNDIAVFVSTFFQKEANFSSRGRIWSNCIELIRQSPLLGVGYFTTEQYQNLSGMVGGTNAHNMFLTILMNGGFIGLALYIYLVFSTIKGKRKDRDYNRQILIFQNYSIFLLGITSSIIVFSTYGMLGFWILEYYDRVKVED